MHQLGHALEDARTLVDALEGARTLVDTMEGDRTLVDAVLDTLVDCGVAAAWLLGSWLLRPHRNVTAPRTGAHRSRTQQAPVVEKPTTIVEEAPTIVEEATAIGEKTIVEVAAIVEKTATIVEEAAIEPPAGPGLCEGVAEGEGGGAGPGDHRVQVPRGRVPGGVVLRFSLTLRRKFSKTPRLFDSSLLKAIS